MRNITSIVFGLFILTGCAGHPTLEHPRYARPEMPPAPVTSPADRGGSLYATATEMTLFEDIKASRRGDIVNIILAENNTAKKSSDTSVSKTNEATINNPILGGKEREELGTIWGRPFNLGFGLDSEQSFAGQSGSNQSNQLSGSIAVTVVQELGRGNLLVQGEKWIRLNQGNEFIRIRGVIRKADITNNNTILSTQIADARIAYSGTGATSDANSMGWLSRFFNSALQPF